ncbi:hypothetical protein ACFSJU_17010 [Paradesertivirga mongoliensis]|uniref:Uncharacterized protein n=1 Tax=Paradesertivirga mongoliensis TaxID=2100740 RepID=A0ABW4ZQK5_9SPHI|nr:hypothetical protein [Pedobacter mongoliensis]
MLIDPEESLIDDSPLNDNDDPKIEKGSLIDDSPLNNEKEEDDSPPATILPPPD